MVFSKFSDLLVPELKIPDKKNLGTVGMKKPWYCRYEKNLGTVGMKRTWGLSTRFRHDHLNASKNARTGIGVTVPGMTIVFLIYLFDFFFDSTWH
jgi:hypothetical protein